VPRKNKPQIERNSQKSIAGEREGSMRRRVSSNTSGTYHIARQSLDRFRPSELGVLAQCAGFRAAFIWGIALVSPRSDKPLDCSDLRSSVAGDIGGRFKVVASGMF
jgi:hypothetical protein